MFKDYKIGTRLGLGFGIILVLFCMLTFFAVNRIQFIGAQTSMIYNHPLTVSNAVLRVNTNIVKIHRTMKDIVLDKTAVEIHRDAHLVDGLEHEIYADFILIDKWFLGDGKLYQKAYNTFIDWKPIRDEVIALMLVEKTHQAVNITRNKGALHVVKIEKAMSSLSAFADNKATEFLNGVEQVTTQSLEMIYLLLLIVVVAVSVLTFYLSKSITHPVRILQLATRKIGQGKFDTEVNIHGGGEVGELASSVKEMASNLSKVTASRDELNKEIIERKHVEQELLLLSSSVEQANESIIITDTKGKIQYVNSAFTRLTGYLEKEAIGQNPRILNSGSQSNEYYKEMWSVINSGNAWQGRIIDKRKDGECYPAMLTISPIKNAAGKVTNYVGIQQDLSDYEDLEQQFYQAQKMEAIGTLVGGIAHDFNNTLAGITGNLYLARKEVSQLPKTRDRLEQIESLAFRAGSMIQQLLAFARKGVVSMNPITISSFLKETVKIHEVSIPENIELSYKIEDGDMQINGDINQLQQVLMNLINNAKDAVAGVDNPWITLKLSQYEADKNFIMNHADRKSDKFVLISIADNGYGISEMDMVHIFEPYYTTKEAGEGTGLGLAMCHGAMTSHNGVVEVESKPGETKFSLYFPLLGSRKGSEVMASESEAVEGGGETILLVDDEESVIHTAKEVLEQLNYVVKTASNGVEAIEIYRENPSIELIVLDVVMPKMGGADAAVELRKLNNSVKIIFITGYERDSQSNGSSRLESEVVLSKPFSVVDLSKAVRDQLDA